MQQFILKRRHISNEFGNVFKYPLAVAVAAMGYGKTTSAACYLNEENKKYIWVSVESDESSPQYLWDSLTRQMIKANPELGKQLHALGFPSNNQQRDKVLKTFEDFTYLTDTVLVIDDYHYARSMEFDSLIERIVRANITGFHILILSRTIPEFKIDELILKEFCYLIKNNLFEISRSEINEYFSLYGYEISIDTAKRVYEISEGWVSAVYLIMQRYAEIGRLEPGRSMEKLIETAVISRYTDCEMKLLISLSILDSFTPELAVFVTGDIEAEAIVHRLSESNSFIRYDQRNNVFRIHNILNSYLRTLLEKHPYDIDKLELNKRTGQWYISCGDIISGIKHLLKAEEFHLIMEEFEKSYINVVIDSNPKYIVEVFKQIPEEIKYMHPIGFLAYTGFYVTNVDQAGGAQLLSEIESFYLKNESLHQGLKMRIFGEIELIRAYIAFNDASLMYMRLKKAHDMLGGRSAIANKDKVITFGSPHALYLYYREAGKLLWTRNCVEEMFPFYMEMAGGCGKGFGELLRAEYCLETGDLGGAELYSWKARYKAKPMDQVSVLICASFALARMYLAQGKFDKALEIMDELSYEVEMCNLPMLNSAYDLCTGYLGGILGKEAAFAEWLRQGAMDQSEVLYQGMGFNYIIYGKYLLSIKNYIKLEVLCEDIKQSFSHFNNLFGYLHAYLLEAIAKYNLYGLEHAITPILYAIDIGRRDDIVLPFAEYCVYILDILKKLCSSTYACEYLDWVTAYASSYYDNLKKFEGLDQQAIMLTNREKDILRMVIEGKTNRDISTELYIAEVTVRKNITSIYRKLDVNGRASAVKKSIELKLV